MFHSRTCVKNESAPGLPQYTCTRYVVLEGLCRWWLALLMRLVNFFFVVDLEKLRRRTGIEGEISKKERRIEANE